VRSPWPLTCATQPAILRTPRKTLLKTLPHRQDAHWAPAKRYGLRNMHQERFSIRAGAQGGTDSSARLRELHSISNTTHCDLGLAQQTRAESLAAATSIFRENTARHAGRIRLSASPRQRVPNVQPMVMVSRRGNTLMGDPLPLSPLRPRTAACLRESGFSRFQVQHPLLVAQHARRAPGLAWGLAAKAPKRLVCGQAGGRAGRRAGECPVHCQASGVPGSSG